MPLHQSLHSNPARQKKDKTEEILEEAHAGYRPSRSIIDQTFTLTQIAAKSLISARHSTFVTLISARLLIAYGRRCFGK